MRVIIDGVPHDEHTASVSVFDWAVVRGFGVFEVVRSYGGALFRLDSHLDRLEHSARALTIAVPDRDAIAADMRRVAVAGGDGQVRLVLTGGGRDASVDAPPHTIVLWEPLPFVPDRMSVVPVVAPWHPATDVGDFAGVKWTSYAPNMATTDRARRAGFDDAILVSTDGIVLEGPTFTCAWVSEGRVETPSLDLGILPSITRDVVLECCSRLGIPVDEGRYPLARVTSADEVWALSTLKQVVPVERVGESRITGGPIAARVAATFVTIVREETTR